MRTPPPPQGSWFSEGRKPWLTWVAREFQLLACPSVQVSARDLLAMPARFQPATRLEMLVLRGLIAELAESRRMVAPRCSVRDTRPDIPLADDVREFIESHYAEHVTIAMLVKRFRRSKSQLCLVFRKSYGTTLHAYLTRVRIEKSLPALQLSNAKIEAVALDAGYRSKKDFYHAVRVATGLTPSAIRAASRPSVRAPAKPLMSAVGLRRKR